jgi:hypothetical protein
VYRQAVVLSIFNHHPIRASAFTFNILANELFPKLTEFWDKLKSWLIFHAPLRNIMIISLVDALRSQNDHIALTWLLRERSSGIIVAYMSLIADAIKLSVSEKETHALNYPFKTIPAMKVAKLAVSQSAQKECKGLGTYMITNALALPVFASASFLPVVFLP